MRRAASGVGVIAMVLAATVSEADEAVRVQASVDKPRVAVGERLRYTVVVEHPSSLAVTIAPLELPSDVWSVETTPSRPQMGNGRDSSVAVLMPYKAGTQTIPAPIVRYRAADAEREARGEPLTVTVDSALPADWQSQDIRGIKPPLFLAWRWIVPLGLLLAALGTAWIAWRRRRRPIESTPAPPPVPPHVAALRELEQLEREALLAQGHAEAYYVRLSAIVRRYVEGRFGLRAPEMTTEEFLSASTRSMALLSSHRQLLNDFLRQSDLVKFARYQPSAHEADQALAAARRLVEETKPADSPATAMAESRSR